MPSRTPTALLAGLLATLGCRAPDGFSVQEENDYFGLGERTDRNYSQGLIVNLHYRPGRLPAAAAGVDEALGRLGPLWTDAGEPAPDAADDGEGEGEGEGPERFGLHALSIGHRIYTPNDLELDPPDPTDRPYAGWLSVTLEALSFESGGPSPHGDPRLVVAGDSQQVSRLTLGVIGPLSGAELLQTEVHDWIGSTVPQGWDSQLGNEPTAMFTVARSHRLWATADPRSGLAADLTASYGTSLGTPHTSGSVSLGTRLGLRPPRFAWFDVGPGDNTGTFLGNLAPRNGGTPEGAERWHVYGVANLRGSLVGYNSFLDGSLDGEGPQVEREAAVGEVQLGIVVGKGPLSVGWILQARSSEFEGSDGGHRIGAIVLSYSARL